MRPSTKTLPDTEASPPQSLRGRKERHLSGNDPVTAFALKLRHARRQAGGPSYRRMATVAHYSAPALSQAASGRRLPSWPLTAAYLRACGVTALADWENDWHVAHLAVQLTGATPHKNVIGRCHRIYDHQGCASTPDSEARRPQQLLDLLTSLAHRKGLTPRAIAASARRTPAMAADNGSMNLPAGAIRDVLEGRAPVTAEFISAFLRAIAASPEERRIIGQAIAWFQYGHVAQAFQPQPPANPVGQVRWDADCPAIGASESHPLAQPADVSSPSARRDSRVRSHRMADGFRGQPIAAQNLAPSLIRRAATPPGARAGVAAAIGILLNFTVHLTEMLRAAGASAGDDRHRGTHTAAHGGEHADHDPLAAQPAVTPDVEPDTLPMQGHPTHRPTHSLSRICAHHGSRPRYTGEP